jgi:hypothetical protein
MPNTFILDGGIKKKILYHILEPERSCATCVHRDKWFFKRCAKYNFEHDCERSRCAHHEKRKI